MLPFLSSILFFVVVDAKSRDLFYLKTVTTTHPTGVIFDGTKVDIKEAPYHVSISQDSKPRCAGIIISEEYVLTAAHCDLLWGSVKLHAGSSLRNNGSVHTIAKQYAHENYPVTNDGFGNSFMTWDESRYVVIANDISLLKVSPPFSFDDNHQPIELFDEFEDVGVYVNAVVTGWTKINGSEHLVSTTVQTLDVQLCNKKYESVGGIPAGQICATYPGSTGKNGCVGVSGGPLVVNGRLAGILSWGNGCVKARQPGVYTEIAYYRHWIDETMQKNSAHK